METSKSRETEPIRALVTELLEQLDSRERPELVAIAERLGEIQRCTAALAISLERLSFTIPIHQTAHLAMEALLRNARGPQDVEEIAKEAYRLALAMDQEARVAVAKFVASKESDQQLVREEAPQGERDTVRPPAGDGDNGTALRAGG